MPQFWETPEWPTRQEGLLGFWVAGRLLAALCPGSSSHRREPPARSHSGGRHRCYRRRSAVRTATLSTQPGDAPAGAGQGERLSRAAPPAGPHRDCAGPAPASPHLSRPEPPRGGRASGVCGGTGRPALPAAPGAPPRRPSHVLQLPAGRAQGPQPGPALAAQERQHDARQEAGGAGAGRERPERPLRPAGGRAGRAGARGMRPRARAGAGAAPAERGAGGERRLPAAPRQPGPARLHLQPPQAPAEPQQRPGQGLQLLGAAHGMEVLRVPLHRVSSAPLPPGTCSALPLPALQRCPGRALSGRCCRAPSPHGARPLPGGSSGTEPPRPARCSGLTHRADTALWALGGVGFFCFLSPAGVK